MQKVEFKIIEELLSSYSCIVNNKGQEIWLNYDEMRWEEDCCNPSIYIFKHLGAGNYPRNLIDLSKNMDGLNDEIYYREATWEEDEDECQTFRKIEKFLNKQKCAYEFFSIAEIQGYIIIKRESDPAKAHGIMYAKSQMDIKEQLKRLERYLMGEFVEISVFEDGKFLKGENGVNIYEVDEILVRDYGVNPELTRHQKPIIYKAS